MMTFKERAKASSQTKAKLQKPLNRSTAAAMKTMVNNAINDLDNLAWKLENQIDFEESDIHSVFPVIKKIDAIIKDAKSLEKDLKKILKV